MERMTWMTEERIGAPATGAPPLGRIRAAATSTGGHIQKRAGSRPPAFGLGVVCGSYTVTSHMNDHAVGGRTAWDGTPLGSPGAGNG